MVEDEAKWKFCKLEDKFCLTRKIEGPKSVSVWELSSLSTEEIIICRASYLGDSEGTGREGRRGGVVWSTGRTKGGKEVLEW